MQCISKAVKHSIIKVIIISAVLCFIYLLIAQTEADLVLINGNIITVNSNDDIVQAVAVKDSLIIAVGANEDVQPYIGNNTEVIDLEGKTVTPGLIDSHSHLMYYGQSENDFVNLRPPEVQTIADVVAKVAEKVSELDSGEWVIGDGYFKLQDALSPTRYDIDPVSPNNPVFLNSIGGHFGTANSKAFEVAGITKDSPNPVGGIIEKDSTTGELTGVLWNHPAMDLIRIHYPPFDLETLEYDILFAQDRYIQDGVTSFQDVNTRALARLRAYGNVIDELKIRGYLLYTVEKSQDAKICLEYTTLFKSPKLTYAGNKFLLDGQPPTSYCYEPHTGSTHELPTWNPDTLKKVVKDLHRAGHQIAFHVMGDRAIDLALDAIEEAQQDTPREDPRHRLEHCMIPTAAAILRIKDLGMVVSLQTASIFYSGDAYINVWGNERVKRLKPMKSLLDAGITVALGSDFPTVPALKPQYALWGAVVRNSSSGVTINAAERVTIQEALYAHTMGSAYAAFEEEVKGSIEVGKYADMSIWSGDPYTVSPGDIRLLEITDVIIGGKINGEPVTGVHQQNHTHLPATFNLYQNYPNPFNASTEIRYEILQRERSVPVTISVFNILGEKVTTLVDQKHQPGRYSVSWNGKDDGGNAVASGVYTYRMTAGNYVQTQQMILQK